MSPAAYSAAADAVLITHLAFVAFVILGLFLVLVGGPCRWQWVRNPWFRFAHLAGIGLVVVQAWCGVICPLTTLEMHLRERAGDATYHGTFVAHWLQRVLYFEAPPWVFAGCYTLFALAVIGSWWMVRPRAWRTKRG
jgi:hypothetical protein